MKKTEASFCKIQYPMSNLFTTSLDSKWEFFESQEFLCRWDSYNEKESGIWPGWMLGWVLPLHSSESHLGPKVQDPKGPWKHKSHHGLFPIPIF